MGLVASSDSMDAILEWRYVVDGSATYFAAADGEAVFSAIERFVDEHGDLPWFVVVDQVAYELRWHSVTHPKKATNAKRGRPSVGFDGPRRRSMFRDVRNAQDRRFIEAGALYHVKPLSRKEYQAAARGDPWVYPKPRRLLATCPENPS